MGSINRRLKALEGMAGQNPCPVCSAWFAIRVNGELDTLTRDGIEADKYQRREYLEHARAVEKTGGLCPACGSAQMEIRVPGMSGPANSPPRASG